MSVIARAVLAALCTALSGVAQAQAPAPSAPQMSAEELQIVYRELVETHDGFVYNVNLVGYPSEEAARKGWEQMQQPRFRAQRLDKIFKNVTPRNITLYVVDPPMREKLAVLDEGERSGPVLTVRGWMIVEVVSKRVAAAPAFETAQVGIPNLVASGILPSAAQLQSDPALRSRTAANRISTVADLDAAPAGLDLNMKLSSLNTLLTRSILLGRADLMDALLKRGANPNLCARKFCPLELAVLGKVPEMPGLLLKAGADPNQSDPAIGALEGPLNAVAFRGDLELANRLIAAGAKVDGLGRGQTPLMVAASAGNRAMAELLIAKGADVFAVTNTAPERTALDFAERGKHAEFAAWLRGAVRAKARESGQYAWEGWIEQDGRRHALDGKPIALKRAPFRIIVRMKPERMLYASASSDRRLFADFAKGERDSGLYSTMNIGAEGPEPNDLVVYEPQKPGERWGGSHAWWNEAKGSRFTKVTDTPQGREHAREIRSLVVIDAAEKVNDPVPVAAYKGASLYLVLGTRVRMTFMDDEVFGSRNVELRFN